jgi:hypothetical protein
MVVGGVFTLLTALFGFYVIFRWDLSVLVNLVLVSIL